MIMKKIKYLLLSTVILMTTSCAEFFEFVEIAERSLLNPLYSVTLSPGRVDLLIGDTVVFDAEVLPDTVDASYRWYLSDAETTVVSLIGKRMYARSEGEVTVYVEAIPLGMTSGDIPADSMVVDSCLVSVSRRTEVSQSEFPYETILIAALEMGDTVVTDPVQVARLTALSDGEVRGRAVMRTAYGIPYLELRIGGRQAYGEEITIDYYDRDLRRRHVFTTFTFDGETHGTLSDPVIFRIEEPADIDKYAIEKGGMTLND